jgi:hypothetical protein
MPKAAEAIYIIDGLLANASEPHEPLRRDPN